MATATKSKVTGRLGLRAGTASEEPLARDHGRRLHAIKPGYHKTLCGYWTATTFHKRWKRLRREREQVNQMGYSFCRECIGLAYIEEAKNVNGTRH